MTVAQFWAGGSSEVRITRRLRGSTWAGRGGSGIGKISGSIWWDELFQTESGVRPKLALNYRDNLYAKDTGSGLEETTFPDLHTYDGASLATQIDADGNVAFKPHNLARASQEFDNATMWRTNGGTTVSTTTAPDGTSTAYTYTEDTAGGTHGFLSEATNRPPVSPNSLYRAQIYIGKASTRRYIVVLLGQGGLTGGVTFDTLNGVITEEIEIAGATVANSGVESVGDYWRVFIDVNWTIGALIFFIQSAVNATGNGSSPNITGDGSTIILWGFQANSAPMAAARDTFSDTYVPTGVSQVFQHRIEPNGLVMELAGTNLSIESENLGEGFWGFVNASTLVNQAIAPNGRMAMDRLIVDTTNGQHTCTHGGVAVSSAVDYTSSCFMKDDGAGFGCISFGSGEHHISVVADLTTGEITTTDVGTSSGTIDNTRIVDFGDGIYRVSVSGKVTATSINHQFGTSNSGTPTFDAGGRASYVGVLGEDIFIWGTQLELGIHASSYIPTTTVAVTRLKEDLDILTVDFDFNDTGVGAIFSELNIFGLTSAPYNWQIDDGAGVARVGGLFDANGKPRLFSSTGFNLFYSAAITFGTAFKSGVSWKLNDGSIAVDGGSAETDSTGSVPTGLTTLNVGNSNGANQLNGNIASLAYYNEDLSDADLVGITA